jgi:preprotein translocase subunit SecD
VATRPSRPGRTLIISFLVLAAMYAGVAALGSWAPKLGLDLQGGTRITLSASSESGSGGVTTDKMNLAVDIIRNRVNGTGVAEAEVTTQGGRNIIVEIPGKQRKDIVDEIGKTAQLRFRLVAAGPAPGSVAPIPSASPGGSPSGTSPGPSTSSPSPSGSPSTSPTTGSPTGSPPGSPGTSPTKSPTATPKGRAAAGLSALDQGKSTPTPTATPSRTPTSAPTTPAGTPTNPTATPTATPTGAATPSATSTGTVTLPPDTTITDPMNWKPDPAWLAAYGQFTCPVNGAISQATVDKPDQPLLACDDQGQKFLLGPALIEGTQLDDASAGIPANQAAWVVNLDFDGSATKTFSDVTSMLFNNGGLFAIVLDGVVLSSPGVTSPIPDGRAEISGSFNQQTATSLANSLKYGALPLTFRTESVTEEGPELASDQLRAGILAGIAGLLLVIVYSLFYYRGLGLVVICSLLVAGLTTYASVLLLGRAISFTLTLPGIAGLIVAVGITADSFIVYFERLRDEVRGGKSLRTAVEAGWVRARTTILAADAVSFLAALVLYIFAIGVVKGFAFALGLTTIIDVFIVFFFTKPVVTLLARTRFFGDGHKLSGLDPKHLGVDRLPSIRGRRRPAEGGAA